jgi:hypothetical protein
LTQLTPTRRELNQSSAPAVHPAGALRLCKQRVDNVAFDIRQAVIAALRSVRQALVISHWKY